MIEDAEKQRVTLPASLLAVIKSITSDEDLMPGHRLSGVLLMVWGYAWYERQESVDPTAVALPSAQWREICGYLTSGVDLDPLAGVNLGLSWMNSGPSAYED
jgi:hypothetical protein